MSTRESQVHWPEQREVARIRVRLSDAIARLFGEIEEKGAALAVSMTFAYQTWTVIVRWLPFGLIEVKTPIG